MKQLWRHTRTSPNNVYEKDGCEIVEIVMSDFLVVYYCYYTTELNIKFHLGS